jgi:Fe-S-cluster containining protein
MNPNFICREKCGACCIIPSISSPIPGMPHGKAGGVRCIHLDEDMKCRIFNHDSRPAVCSGFKAEELVCGRKRSDAARILSFLEGIDLHLDDIE